MAADPLCVEQFVDGGDGDNCCVIVTCASGAAPVPGAADDACADVECGPNAVCRREVSASRDDDGGNTICVCADGHTGDPDSAEGCTPDADAIAADGDKSDGDSADESGPDIIGCQQEDKTYGLGEEWFDGCDFSCQCSASLEIVCQPRCKVPPLLSEHCELREDPSDPCCQVMFCPEEEGSELKPVEALEFDGCLFKNQSYGQGERFYDGCEQQCQCMGYGDMVCLAR